jgi:transposase
VREVNELVATVFSGLSALVIEGVTDEGEVNRVSARTRDDPVTCPACGARTARKHGFHARVIADVPVDGRQVVASVRVRRLVCPVLGCPRQTFREQVLGVVERAQGSAHRPHQDGPRHITRLSHSHHQLGGLCRTRRP